MTASLDDFAERGRAAVIALAPVVHPTHTGDPTDPEVGQEIVFGALVALMHYCHAAEIDLPSELAAARNLVASDLRDDLDMRAEGGAE